MEDKEEEFGGNEMKLNRRTKTFTVWDYRDSPYNHIRGIDITAGQGDGLYQLNLPELKELKELVEDLIQELESKP